MVSLNNVLLRSSVTYDMDAPVVDEVRRLSYLDLYQFRDHFEGDWSRSSRTKLRYLAALFPDESLNQLAQTVHAVLGNMSVSVADVRMILAGRSLADASKVVDVVPVEALQAVGRVLIAGGSVARASRAGRVSIDLVYAIDSFLGLSQRAADVQLDAVIDAVREGMSVRQVAARLNVPKSTAHRLMVKAREVLVELGEL